MTDLQQQSIHSLTDASQKVVDFWMDKIGIWDLTHKATKAEMVDTLGRLQAHILTLSIELNHIKGKKS